MLPDVSNATDLDHSSIKEKEAYTGSLPPKTPPSKHTQDTTPVDAKYGARETIDKIPEMSASNEIKRRKIF